MAGNVVLVELRAHCHRGEVAGRETDRGRLRARLARDAERMTRARFELPT